MTSPLQLLPNLRTEPATATTGYTWGKPVASSNILRILKQAQFPEIETELGLSADDIVAERWLVSDDPALGSVVVNQEDPTQNQTLRELLDDSAAEILGQKHVRNHGPYLSCIMKQLDTNAEPTKGSLSVQIHPKPGHPSRPAKPEMWLGTGNVYLGWQTDVDSDQIREAYEAGSLETLMNQIELTPQKLVLVDGGTIHAIRYDSFLFKWSMAPGKDDVSKGNLKDATVSPYDRTDGKTPRPGKEDLEASITLLEESAGLAGSNEAELLTQPIPEWTDEHGNSQERLFATQEVFVHRVKIASNVSLDLHQIGRGIPIYVNQGQISITTPESKTTWQAGQELFLPYNLMQVEITALHDQPVELLYWYAPFEEEYA